MVHEPSNDTERFFNKYVEARYYANLKKEIYTERRIELKEDEFLEEQQVFEDKGWN